MMRRLIAVVVGGLVLAACGSPPFPKLQAPETDTAVDDPWDVCDAGDTAWVQRVLPLMWGRQAHGAAEVEMWVGATEQAGRAAVLDALARDPAYLDHQTDVFMDALKVPRTGSRVDYACWAGPILDGDSGELAAFLADASPGSAAGGTYNMADVVRSSLLHDDLSVVYRTALFARLHKPMTGANVGPLELEENRRLDMGDEFVDVWLRRDLDCLPCHNSAYSYTGDPDPTLDRTWEIPGLFEQALFGDDVGIAVEEAYAIFRYEPVAGTDSGELAPFGLTGCGAVSPPGGFGTDMLGHDAYFISALGSEGSVWDVEAALHQGVDALRGRGHVWGASDVPSGPEAFAWLVGESIAEQVWFESIGARLSLSHRFPRNQPQRDRLFDLTNHLVTEGFSLRALLTDIALDPLFNPGLPDTCGADAYGMPPVIAPFSEEEEDPAMQGNGPGDRVRRWPGRVLVRSTHDAMGWPPSPRIPTEDDPVLDVYEGIGVSLRRSQSRFDGVDFQGLLAWESHFGACVTPELEPGSEDGCTATAAVPGCGNCDCQACTCAHDPYCCAVQWDDSCVETCDSTCGGCGVGTREDTVERLLAGAVDRGATVGELVVALKDRMLTDGTLDGDETALMEAILGLPLDHTVEEALTDDTFEASLRLLCGALLRTPDFLLELERTTVGTVPPLALDVADDCARLEGLMAAAGHPVSCAVEVP